jgi:hypothetical protein
VLAGSCSPVGPRPCHATLQPSHVLDTLVGDASVPHPGDAKGYWSGVADLAQCAERCRSCANCRYVSFSWAHDECAWFTHCRLPLEQKFQGDTYQTLKVVSSMHVARNQRDGKFSAI